MAKSLTTRFGLQRWTDDLDTQDRSEFDDAHRLLEERAAGAIIWDSTGEPDAIPRPAAAAAYDRFLSWDRATGRADLCVDTTGAGGWAWVEVLTRDAGNAAYAPINPPTARYKRGTAQSIPNNTLTTVSWDAVVREGGVTNAVPFSTVTLPSEGWWEIDAEIRWAANATGYRSVAIRNAAATWLAEDHRAASPTGSSVQKASTGPAYFAAGSLTFEVLVTQTSGGALDVAAFHEHTHLTVTKVR